MVGDTLVIPKFRQGGAIQILFDSFHHAREGAGLANCGPTGLLLSLHRFTRTLRNFTDTNRTSGLI